MATADLFKSFVDLGIASITLGSFLGNSFVRLFATVFGCGKAFSLLCGAFVGGTLLFSDCAAAVDGRQGGGCAKFSPSFSA